jgi:hypothetical protein
MEAEKERLRQQLYPSIQQLAEDRAANMDDWKRHKAAAERMGRTWDGELLHHISRFADTYDDTFVSRERRGAHHETYRSRTVPPPLPPPDLKEIVTLELYHELMHPHIERIAREISRIGPTQARMYEYMRSKDGIIRHFGQYTGEGRGREEIERLENLYYIMSCENPLFPCPPIGNKQVFDNAVRNAFDAYVEASRNQLPPVAWPGIGMRQNNRAQIAMNEAVALALQAANGTAVEANGAAVVPVRAPVRNDLTPEEQAQLDAAIAVPTPDVYWNIPRGTRNSRYGELIQEGDELINLHGNAHFIAQHEGLHGVHKKARANMIYPYMWRNITNPNSDPPIRRFRARIVGGRRTRRRNTRKPRSTRSKH